MDEIKMYEILAFIDNGMERFHVHWYVFARNEEDAKRYARTKLCSDDIIDILNVDEIELTAGLIMRGMI